MVRAVLDWAGLDEDDADLPGSEPIAPPCRLSAELIGEEALDELKRRGFRLVGPQARQELGGMPEVPNLVFKLGYVVKR